MFRILILLLACGTMLCCSESENSSSNRLTLFKELSSEETGIQFKNEVVNSDRFNIFNYRNFYNGGGVGIGDINNDGLQDVYMTANLGANRLFINKGNFEFEDITAKSGISCADKWSTGTVMVDINGDGYLDIYVCNAGYQKGKNQRNELYINNGDQTFTESAEQYGLDENGYTTHAAFFDFDKDGDLDVYILNNSFIPTNTLNYTNQRELKAEDWPVKDFLKGGGDKFLRNDNGKYVDASDQVKIFQSLIGFGLGVTVGDVNDDGWDDLYISNDFFERDYLYINDTKGAFTESLEEYFEHVSHSSMGADMQDVNNDGRPDIFVTDMLPRSEHRLKTTASFDDINLRKLKEDRGFYNQFMHNTLQINAGKQFKDVAFNAGVAASDWSWGALMFDADNDGRSDLLVCNGIYHDVIDLDFMDFFANEVLQKMASSGKKEQIQEVIDKMPSTPVPNQMFKNVDGYSFADVSKEWGLGRATFSNGAAYGDLDNDGDYDLVINNVNQDALVYRNTSDNPFLSISLQGPNSNPNAIGAKIKVYSGDQILYRQINPSRGFQSSCDYKQIIGLGANPIVDSILIIWQDGSRKVVKEVNPSSEMIIEYQQSNQDFKTPTLKAFWRGEELTNISPSQEDEYIDYYAERGLYRILSKEGPASCLGDVNGDGLKDLYLGGASGQEGQLYLASKKGFVLSPQSKLSEDKACEDTAASFVDIEGDGDLDLIVGSGGNHLEPNHKLLYDRLYINDGKGSFQKDKRFSTQAAMNTSCIIALDYDQDGDEDLFIGSRSVPMHFGYSPVHFILNNDGAGKYTDVSAKIMNNFSGFGMITDASAVDLDGDQGKELLLVGEWEAPRIFKYTNDKFEEITSNLSQESGWYFTCENADVNGDGLEDLIFGNTGSNFYLQASKEAPIKLWVNDFDNNGFVDKVITYTKSNRDIPIHLKREMADQIVSIKKQNLKNEVYATKSIQDLFDKALIDKSKVKTAVNMKSYLAINKGDFTFEIQNLPVEAQLSSVKAIQTLDADKDGDLDILLGGNDYNLIPQLSRLDASFGAYLKNDGKGNFTFVPETQSGINIKGEVKAILPINETNAIYIRNGKSPVKIEYN